MSSIVCILKYIFIDTKMKDQNLDAKYVKNYYDTFLSQDGGEYAYHRWHKTPVHEAHFIQTRRTLKRAFSTVLGKVLEIGGGDAMWTMFYIDKIEHLTYLDVSEEMLSQAKTRLKEKAGKVEFIQGDFLENKLTSESFDNFISIRNFEYFKDKDFAVNEMNRLLKKDGTLLVVTKSKEYNLHTNLKKRTLHSDQVRIEDFLEMLRENGFEIQDVKPAIFGKLLKFSIFRVISNFIHICILRLPWKILPIKFLGYLSESFYVKAKKK